MRLDSNFSVAAFGFPGQFYAHRQEYEYRSASSLMVYELGYDLSGDSKSVAILKFRVAQKMDITEQLKEELSVFQTFAPIVLLRSWHGFHLILVPCGKE